MRSQKEIQEKLEWVEKKVKEQFELSIKQGGGAWGNVEQEPGTVMGGIEGDRVIAQYSPEWYRVYTDGLWQGRWETLLWVMGKIDDMGD